MTSQVHAGSNVPVLYLGGAWVSSFGQGMAVLTKLFCGFSQTLQAITGLYLKIGHNHFLPRPLHFIVLNHLFSVPVRQTLWLIQHH
jgi:hypothetical protein